MRILFNSLDQIYKTPFGTVIPGQECRMHIAIPASCQTRQVTLRLEQENGTPSCDVPFVLQKIDGPYEWYEGTLQIDTCGLYFYYFQITTANECFRLFKQGEDTNMEAGDKWQISCVTDEFPVPAYARGAVMYQIFPDRFYQVGSPDLTGKLDPYWVHKNVDEMPEFRPDAKGEVLNNDFFGGNFAGIQAKLPYLKELGVNIIYLNPIFKAYSNHRYDTCDYLQPDPMLGTTAEFCALCDAAHELGMRIILDGVFSHTGSDSIYFDKKRRFGGGAYAGPDSPYYTWYDFKQYPDNYTSWWGINTLPCVNKLHPDYLDYIIDREDSVVAHWLRLGADGWRLDVVDEIPDEFVLRLRKRIREVKPDALLIGEVWEDASNKVAHNKRRRYFVDGELDSVMNYPWRKAIIDYCTDKDRGHALRESVMRIAENYPKDVLDCTMNMLGTHDTPRILTLLGGSVDGTKEEQSKRVMTPAQRKTALERLRMAAFLEFCLPGMACIYYADEAGMEGCADPFNRQYFPWGKEDVSLTGFYRGLAKLKNKQDALKYGTICDFTASNGQITFCRKTETESLRIACNRSDVPMEVAGTPVFGHGIGLGYADGVVVHPGGFCVCSGK